MSGTAPETGTTPTWRRPSSLEPCGTFLWGGWAIVSNLDLPRLGSISRTPELSFVWRDEQPPASPEPTMHRTIKRRDGGLTAVAFGGDEERFRYEVEGVGAYVLEPPTGEVSFYPEPEADPMRVEHHLVNGVLAIFAGLRGELCFHAASVDVGGRAVLLGGPSGVGKSTRAWELIRAGGRLLADDYTLVRHLDDVWLAYPGGRTLRLDSLPPEAGWDNAGKTETLVETDDAPAPVEEIQLLGVDVGCGMSRAEAERSLMALQAGWAWIGPRRRAYLLQLVERLAGKISIQPTELPVS